MGGCAPGFGAELRRRRKAVGLSLTELSAMLHYSKGYLSKIENDRKAPSPELARRCDSVLGADGALLVLAPGRRSYLRRRVRDDAAGEGLTDGYRLPDAAHSAARRDEAGCVPLGPGVTVTTLAAVGLAAQHDRTAAGFQAMFIQVRRLGMTISPALVLPILAAQIKVLRELASAADGSSRRRLLLLAARYAEYAGWMAQEAGDDRAAGWWTDMAVGFATAAGDRDLASYALVRHALIALYRRDACRTVALARRAQSHREVAPRVLGLAAQREAQGHALAGDYDDCQRALERARDLLAVAGPDGSGLPVLGSSTVPDSVDMVTAWCLYDLGRPQQAVDMLQQELARVPATAARARTRFAVRLSMARAAVGDLDGSCATAAGALPTAAIVDSATIRLDLRDLARVFARWPRHPAVAALSPQLGGVRNRPAPGR
ncbi:helix-turn-helix transcriptional regulator [Frankia sp. Cr1]|uniref:helix-turn-helix transcriptional regulator n=1 Tax=Frankia sp. Cr1 TaxID=3073931 RepID=UPI002AD3D34E|nr:helix-turn-helix transcriptional regulator [Frankia sp. Cr1]